ncbi:ABC transporter permease subunit [Planifilum fimeticola]
MGRLLNKALLWKEWRQNRWLLLLLLLFVIYTPIIDAVIFWVDTMMGMYRGLYGLFGSADPWSFKVTSAIKGLMVDESDGWGMGFNPLFPLAPVAVGLWGVLLIARERTPNTLEFLAAAPVSRREIAVTKFFFGAMSIIGMMTVNLLFVLGIMLVAPVGYTWTEALFWFAYCVSYLLSLFSLGFLIAVVTGNWVANLGAVLLCSHLHWLLADTIRFFGLPMGLSDSALERIRNGLEYMIFSSICPTMPLAKSTWVMWPPSSPLFWCWGCSPSGCLKKVRWRKTVRRLFSGVHASFGVSSFR